jgi:hypothetical protein
LWHVGRLATGLGFGVLGRGGFGGFFRNGFCRLRGLSREDAGDFVDEAFKHGLVFLSTKPRENRRCRSRVRLMGVVVGRPGRA